MKHYQEFKERRLRALLADQTKTAELKAAYIKMNKGEEDWSTNIKDFSKLPEPEK